MGGEDMVRKLRFIGTAAVLIASMFAGNVLGCACCSEPGTYALWTGKLQNNELEILKEIKFDRRASLYMTEAGFDTLKGLSSIEKNFFEPAREADDGDFDLSNSFTGKVWTFTFKTPQGNTGTLRLPMPTQMTSFKVDIHDGSNQGLGPLLYKEYRFKGMVASGSGFLGASIVKPTTYFLVFQGRGLACDDVTDFRNWNLEISGRKASYQLYGKLTGTREAGASKASAMFRWRNSIYQ